MSVGAPEVSSRGTLHSEERPFVLLDVRGSVSTRTIPRESELSSVCPRPSPRDPRHRPHDPDPRRPGRMDRVGCGLPDPWGLRPRPRDASCQRTSPATLRCHLRRIWWSPTAWTYTSGECHQGPCSSSLRRVRRHWPPYLLRPVSGTSVKKGGLASPVSVSMYKVDNCVHGGKTVAEGSVFKEARRVGPLCLARRLGLSLLGGPQGPRSAPHPLVLPYLGPDLSSVWSRLAGTVAVLVPLILPRLA